MLRTGIAKFYYVMLAIIVVIMIISSVVCILYCNHLSSSYTDAGEVKKTCEGEEVASSNKGKDDVAVHAVLEE